MKTMDMIIETDLGHDPDDFFTICYLAAVGVNIRCITIVPGDPDQIAIARLLVKELGLDAPVGASKLNREKHSSGGVHHALLKKYGLPLESQPDNLGHILIGDVFQEFPESDLLIIGPASNVGQFLQEHPDQQIGRATMQGGFLPYSVFSPAKRLEKFEGKDWVPSFNPNGDRKAFMSFAEAQVDNRKFVGKNVCHTILYNHDIHRRLKPHNRASELFREAMDIYLFHHSEKKFHDPLAAACHLHPEIGTFVRGKPVKMESGWSVTPDPNGDQILGDVDREAFWKHITEFN